LLTADEEVTLANELGMEAFYYNADLTRSSVELISAQINKMAKPVYIHCHVSTLHYY
jgi:hypothetical protein